MDTRVVNAVPGSIHLPFIYRIVGIIDWDQYADIKLRMADGLLAEGRFTEIWGTGLREPFYDFGIVGGVLFICAMSLACGYCYHRIRRRATLGLTVLSVPPTLIFIMMPLTSPILSPLFFYMTSLVFMAAPFLLVLRFGRPVFRRYDPWLQKWIDKL